MGMSFLDASPQLAGTCFRADDLIAARSVYKDIFADLDPEWPNNPRGPLATHWRAESVYSVTYLIHVARVLRQLSNRNVTTKSTPILRTKVKTLLRPPSPNAYEETLIELEVAAALSERISPISFEPLVPPSLSDAPSKPRSPDFGLRLPESDVTVEVSVWHWQALRDWDSKINRLRTLLGSKLNKAGLRRHVHVELPIRLSDSDLKFLTAKTVLQQMAAATGELTVETNASAIMQWFEMPHFESIEQVDFTQLPPNVNSAVVGSAIGSAFGFSYRPIVDDSWIEHCLPSLRKALDRKSAQRHESLPHVLTLGLGHHRLHWDWILPMFSQRIWPNDKYRWISALCAFSPQRDWQLNAPPTRLSFEWNPGATVRVPESLRGVAEGRETHHL
jgi:hypothetical protein